ncbi:MULTISPECIES: ABC transporter permease [Paenibacillus]|uniref:ABC transporter permease n=1 Tax=Paenibacillus rhizoplanae TaxID=1917181 RepID=A0ABW5FEJ0_9BACL
MRIILSEVKESLFRKKAVTALLLIQLLIFYCVVSLLFVQSSTLHEQSSEVSSLSEMNDYQLSDTLLEDEAMKDYTNRPEFLVNAITLYRNLNEHFEDQYIYLFNQSIAILPEEVEWEPKFMYAYEEGRSSKPFSMFGNGPFYASKAVQMNSHAFKKYNIEVDIGQPFEQEDFNNTDNHTIPVLLGADYKSKYKIGGLLKANYLMKDFELVVKGFLPSNTMVFNSQFPEMFLDRYIVMPAQTFPAPTTPDDFSFQKKHYMQIVNGHIFTMDDEYTIVNKLEEVKQLSDFHETEVLGTHKLPLKFLLATYQISTKWLSIVASVLYVICAVSITLLILEKMRQQLKNMMIHLICGATINQLIFFYLTELIIVVVLPGFIVMLAYKLLIDNSMLLLILVITGSMLTLTLISALPIIWWFKHIDFNKYIKRME